VGGKFTVCVLCYGPHPELARRCVGSILATLPVGRYDLRVAANAACPETLEYLRTVPATKLYVHEENRFKYPVMREMFRDPDAPLATPYLVWFDDDSYARDPLWAARLAKAVAENHRHGVRLFGARFTHDPSAYARPGHDPYAWFRSAPWWRGVPHGTRRDDRPAAGGRHVHFVAGGFWAASVDALRQADVPDARLRHNGGDITIGEQMRQAGYRLGVFDQDKVLVGRSMTPRRGYSEDFPWAGAQPPRPGSRLT
jgi:GT2 family glycosyltransferase